MTKLNLRHLAVRRGHEKPGQNRGLVGPTTFRRIKASAEKIERDSRSRG
jgi:hypothetical protein